MKKSRFFSLLCAFWPGAGEMYLGLMKRGLGIMLAFWGVIAMIVAFQVDLLLFILPVLWFYSFFDTLTLRNLEYDALVELQERDEFFFQELLGSREGMLGALGKHHVLVGWGCIFLGAALLYNRLMRWVWWNDAIPGWVTSILDSIPSLLLAFGVIALGLWLVRGKKLPADKVEDYPQYHGEAGKGE